MKLVLCIVWYNFFSVFFVDILIFKNNFKKSENHFQIYKPINVGRSRNFMIDSSL